MKKHLLINGDWIKASEYRDLYAPYNGDKLAEVAFANAREINLAIDAADRAIKSMAQLTAFQRAEILMKLVELLKGRRHECATIIATESAKPIKAAIVEVDRTIMTYTFAAEEAKRINGETVPMDAAPGGENRIAYTLRQPLGIIAAITPFNFPMNLVAHKIGPAIAAGNTIILKPASQTPLSSIYLGELLMECGLPPGALNIVTGSGAKIGEKLVIDNRIKAITFTGSPQIGKKIKNQAGLKRVTLELGSNSALLIDKNVNLTDFIGRCVNGSFSFAGQVCISLQRIYVHEEIYDQFVTSFLEETKKLKIGNPLDHTTDISSLISEQDVERSLKWINEAVIAGAELVIGGQRRANNTLEPSVLLNVPSTEKISCQEVFAPVVMINKISSMEEGITEINESKYGLQAGIFTNDLQLALKAAERLEVGGVMINDIPTFRVDHMPYGGVKESGIGKEGIKYAIDEMLETKLVCFRKI
ncbi:aldehyde dehydrogenase family protein [Cytobacillus sp. IB215665]|uniref:aldehyde dehydrogenase family protein n=1 Tax=Cytobacillus sp. IB215665 TaxID=3097357 RepID=UPI002A0F177C|nr:aldehyde dehydrogenase family protein [Cytobacillus sp. IB215665]MDX8366244.1 aldehyde dehydrogenase family protein [Cytobacillus sp. IB215665]